jgi:hypothetical protein
LIMAASFHARLCASRTPLSALTGERRRHAQRRRPQIRGRVIDHDAGNGAMTCVPATPVIAAVQPEQTPHSFRRQHPSWFRAVEHEL